MVIKNIYLLHAFDLFDARLFSSPDAGITFSGTSVLCVALGACVIFLPCLRETRVAKEGVRSHILLLFSSFVCAIFFHPRSRSNARLCVAQPVMWCARPLSLSLLTPPLLSRGQDPVRRRRRRRRRMGGTTQDGDYLCSTTRGGGGSASRAPPHPTQK